jgi:hypothetical protein
MLSTFEKILETSADDPEWRQSLKSSIKLHREYLQDRNGFKDRYLKGYTDDLQALIYQKTGRKLPGKDFKVEPDFTIERAAQQ